MQEFDWRLRFGVRRSWEVEIWRANLVPRGVGVGVLGEAVGGWGCWFFCEVEGEGRFGRRWNTDALRTLMTVDSVSYVVRRSRFVGALLTVRARSSLICSVALLETLVWMWIVCLTTWTDSMIRFSPTLLSHAS